MVNEIGLDNIIKIHDLSNDKIYTKPILLDNLRNLVQKKSKIIYRCQKCNTQVSYSTITSAISYFGKCCEKKKNQEKMNDEKRNLSLFSMHILDKSAQKSV